MMFLVMNWVRCPVLRTIDSCVTPVVAATRRVPVALREPLKIELHKLQTMNVIAQVEEPSDWVSNVVVARKKNGAEQGSEEGKIPRR